MSDPRNSMLSKLLVPPADVDEVYRLLEGAMPGRMPAAKGPKKQPNPLRSRVSCMLLGQSRDENTAKASQALIAIAETPLRCNSGTPHRAWHVPTRSNRCLIFRKA
ncbi:MAG: hypothetical protein ACR2PF_14485 [Rhizobiaceae bacterium]